MNLGKIKTWVDVANWYYSKIMQLITVVGVLKLMGLSWWFMIIVLLISTPLLLLVVYLHMKFVFPDEKKYLWDKNPAYKKLIDRE